MRKVCADWKTEAFSPALVNGSYWPDFEENAKAASAEIFCVPDETAAAQKVLEIADEVKADMVVAAGTEIDRGISLACDKLAQAGKQVFRDKFEVAEHAPQAGLGLSRAEFGVGETGSVCVDTYSYEARVVGMLPPAHIVLLDRNALVENVTTAFQVMSRVFQKGYLGFITGPSRTADIERVLSLGVHGPSRFFIVVIGAEGGSIHG